MDNKGGALAKLALGERSSASADKAARRWRRGFSTALGGEAPVPASGPVMAVLGMIGRGDYAVSRDFEGSMARDLLPEAGAGIFDGGRDAAGGFVTKA